MDHATDVLDRLAGLENGDRQRLAAATRRLRETVTLQRDLTAMVAHDLRSPLACVSGYLQVMEESEGFSSSDRERVRRAMGCVRAMAGIISTLLDVSRLEAGKMPLHLGDACMVSLVRDALSTLETPMLPRHRMRILARPVGAVAHCDADLVRRILVNLVANAMKHSPPESTIEVRIAAARAVVHVEVRDHGPGIARAQQAQLFHRFAQLHPQQGSPASPSSGVGLGLLFCKLAVEAHGGRIGLESEEGQGARFWFELPQGHVAQAERVACARTQAASEEPRHPAA